MPGNFSQSRTLAPPDMGCSRLTNLERLVLWLGSYDDNRDDNNDNDDFDC